MVRDRTQISRTFRGPFPSSSALLQIVRHPLLVLVLLLLLLNTAMSELGRLTGMWGELGVGGQPWKNSFVVVASSCCSMAGVVVPVCCLRRHPRPPRCRVSVSR